MNPRPFPYLSKDRDQHGVRKAFVRRYGRKIRLRAQYGTVEFASEYAQAIEALNQHAPHIAAKSKTPAGTLKWLAERYFASAEFKRLPKQSQRTRRGVIEHCLREPYAPGSNKTMAQCPIPLLGAKHIRVLRDRKADKPGASKHRLQYLSSMFSWAVEANLMHHNPCRDVKPLKYESDGFHIWVAEEIKTFEDRHPIGSMARLAFAIMYHLGVRRSDAVKLGPKHIRGNKISFVQTKTRRVVGDAVVLPMPEELADIIAKTPCGSETFLVTSRRRSFTSNGFGNWFRDRCDEAGLPQCSAHGIRKHVASDLAERGASSSQMDSFMGWAPDSKSSATYIKRANRDRMARDAARLR
jgi:integrase